MNSTESWHDAFHAGDQEKANMYERTQQVIENRRSVKMRNPTSRRPPNPIPSTLSRARSLATLLLYVSDARHPASSSPPSGDRCVADAGLIRFCKSKRKDARRNTGGLFLCAPGSGSGRGKQKAITMSLDYSKLDGLIPAVIQDAASHRVLMVGFMNDEAFRNTCDTGFVTFYSRSRNKLWMKGESSGHRLVVREISTDCDDDSLLIKVESLGPGVCHNGYESCFYRKLDGDVWIESEPRTYDPASIYGSKS